MAAVPAVTLDVGLLGDTAERDYGHKLQTFNAFAAPELQACIRYLGLQPGMHVLDAGCGTGEALEWLWQQVGPAGRVTGVDLSSAHIAAARARLAAHPTGHHIRVMQGNLLQLPPACAGQDLIWCVNTINHLTDQEAALWHLRALLRKGGRLALGQSCLLPDMLFAWDARLERLVSEAVRRYYEQRYQLTEAALSPIRAILGLLRRAGFRDVSAHSVLIERTSPLEPAAMRHIAGTLLRDTCGERLRPWLQPEDFALLSAYSTPGNPAFALQRPDFHFLQTFTLVTGQL